MKKGFLIVLLGLVNLTFVFSRPVSLVEVTGVAKTFISEYSDGSGSYKIERILPHQQDGGNLFYSVVLEPKGWLLIAADDVIQPVIGYSFSSPYVSEANWDDNTRNWFRGYSKQIKYQTSFKSASRHEQWNSVSTLAKSTAANKSVEPMLTVEWNQSSGWNRYCPEDEEGPGGHAYVGCVAVAMAQAMSYHQYPESPEGMHSYSHDTYGGIFVNYDSQDPYYWEDMSLEESDTLNAKLLYHCAVAVSMGFGPNGSGASTSQVRNALVNYFSYPSGVMDYITRYEDDEEWQVMLKSVLDEDLPLVYRGDGGDGEQGHAFNIDGYQGDFFHLNWGWSGSMNGFFTINNLAPGSYDLTFGQAALVNIRPPIPGPKEISLSKTSVKENLPEGSFVAVIEVEDEWEENVYEYKIVSGTPIDFKKSASAESMFILSNDTVRTKEVLDKSLNSELTLHILVTDTLENKMDKKFTITVQENKPSVVISNFKENLSLYPNPTNGIVNVILPVEYQDVENKLNVYTSTGVLVYSQIFSSESDRHSLIDLSILEEGLYIISLRLGNHQFNERIILQ